MSASAFTPGPWQWVGHNEIEQAEHPFTSVAEVVLIPKNADPERAQRNANARLIAAAPELYAGLAKALEAMRPLAHYYELNDQRNGNLEVPVRELAAILTATGDAKRVLAKARGEQ